MIHEIVKTVGSGMCAIVRIKHSPLLVCLACAGHAERPALGLAHHITKE